MSDTYTNYQCIPSSVQVLTTAATGTLALVVFPFSKIGGSIIGLGGAAALACMRAYNAEREKANSRMGDLAERFSVFLRAEYMDIIKECPYDQVQPTCYRPYGKLNQYAAGELYVLAALSTLLFNEADTRPERQEATAALLLLLSGYFSADGILRLIADAKRFEDGSQHSATFCPRVGDESFFQSMSATGVYNLSKTQIRKSSFREVIRNVLRLLKNERYFIPVTEGIDPCFMDVEVYGFKEVVSEVITAAGLDPDSVLPPDIDNPSRDVGVEPDNSGWGANLSQALKDACLVGLAGVAGFLVLKGSVHKLSQLSNSHNHKED